MKLKINIIIQLGFICLFSSTQVWSQSVIGQIPTKFTDSTFLKSDLVRLGISNAKRKKLEEIGIKTHTDLLRNFSKIKGVLTEKQQQSLKQASFTLALTDNEVLRKNLEAKGFNSIKELTVLTEKDIRKWSGDIMTVKETEAFLKKVKYVFEVATTIETRKIVESRNPAIFRKPGIVKNPTTTPITTPTTTPITEDYPQNAPDKPCMECDEESNIFSPGVYVLYLLDFVSKVFAPDFEKLDAINRRFYQRLEDVPVFHNLEASGSYVQYANEILENYLAQKINPSNSNPYTVWPNRLQGEPSIFTDYRIPTQEWFSSTLPKKDQIYKLFHANTGVPNPNLIEELFDAYVNELGTSRTDVKIAVLGKQDFQERFAQKIGLELEDLIRINKGNVSDDQNTITIKEVGQIKERIWEFYKRQVDTLQRKEQTLLYAKEYEQKFNVFFRKIQHAQTEQVIKCFLQSVVQNPSEFVLDSLLMEIRGRASNCISLGIDCPDKYNCPALSSLSIPLYRVQALFQHFARFYNNTDRYTDSVAFAQRWFKALRESLIKERYDYLRLISTEGVLSLRDTLETEKTVEERLRSDVFFEEQLEYLGAMVFQGEKQHSDSLRNALIHDRAKRTNELYSEAIKRAEKGFHEKLRDNLIALIMHFEPDLHVPKKFESTSKATDYLANYLFLDLTLIEDFQTTPIAFTISRLHSLIQAAQLGTAKKNLGVEGNYNTSILKKEPWISRWNWMESYAIWHAAMMVSLYPENYMEPKLYKNGSNHYNEFINDKIPPDLIKYWNSVNSLNNLHPLGVFSHENSLFFIAASSVNSINYSVLESDGKWINWQAKEINIGAIDGTKIWERGKIKMLKIDRSLYSFYYKNNNEMWVSKLKISGNTISRETEWKPLTDNFSNDPNMVFFSATTNRKADEFIIGSLDPKQAKGKLLISEKDVPTLSFRGYKYDESRIISKVDKDSFSEQKSKGYEDVDRVLVNSLSNLSNKALWVKGNEAVLTGNPKEIPYKRLLLQTGVNDINFLYGEGDNHFAYSQYQNKLIELKANGKAISISGGAFIAGAALYNGKMYFFGNETSGSVKGAMFYTTEPGSEGSRQYLTEPHLSQIIINEEYDIYKDKIIRGPAEIYNYEAMLHIPLYMADYYTQKDTLDKVTNWLSRIINYNKLDSWEGHPLFGLNESGIRNPRVWLDTPFAPYNYAEMNNSVYRAKVKSWHAESLINLADQAFQIDNAESVNRARELYELALKVIMLGGEIPDDTCGLKNFDFFKNVVKYQAPMVRAGLGTKYTPIQGSIPKLERVLNSTLSNAAKQALINYESNSRFNIKFTLDCLIVRDVKFKNVHSESSEFAAIAALNELDKGKFVSSSPVSNPRTGQDIIPPPSPSPAPALVQQISVRGRVYDIETREPLTSASVLVKGTSKGALTDIDGNYMINGVESNAILSYSYDGYEPQEIRAQSALDVSLVRVRTNNGRIISGRVYDKDSGDPLMGVSVLIKGTNNGTVTDIDGRYRLDSVSYYAISTYSYPGYNTQEKGIWLVDTALTFDVHLSPIFTPSDTLIDIDKQAVVFELKPFCLPRNPQFKILFWRIQSNLEKIRTSRNFAGFERQLPPYAIPLAPERLVTATANGNSNYSQFLGNKQIPFFRYSFLIERAKNLTRLAQQFEGTLLNTEEAEDAASWERQYSITKAKQDIQLQEANLSLQNARIPEAWDMQRQAIAQQTRTGTQIDYYDGLIKEGLNGWEVASVASQYTAAALYATSGIFDFFPATNGGLLPKLDAFSSHAASSAQALGSAFQQQASYERREQEWRFQKQMAIADQKIANVGIDIASDRLGIVQLERNIADLQLSFGKDQLAYLSKKHKAEQEIYRWMKTHLKRLYTEQIGMAIGAARTAQQALEFERQSTIDIIGYDYSKFTKEFTNEGKLGNRYLGAEKLLQDIEKLDNYRVSTTTRKKEIQKSISLSNIAPAEFQRFRETGVLPFETLMQWFDCDFPGHYMRLIHDVDVTVIGLIPPNEGIRATLANDGFSRIVVNPGADEPALIYKYPEAIALSGSSGGNGLFTLRPDDELLYPFEGIGVAGRWIFEMPKGANPIDYNSIADIIVTVRYTALEDRGYRQKVLKKMGQDESGAVKINSRRYFSLKNNFPDQWFLFQNPNCGLESRFYNDPIVESAIDPKKVLVPNTVLLNLKPQDFLPNEDHKMITRITLAVQLSDSLQYLSPNEKALVFNVRLFPSERTSSKVQRFNIKSGLASSLGFNTITPFGDWVIQLEQNCNSPTLKVKPKNIEDILLVIDYEAKVQYNR